jgi:hypothetical protein
MAADWLVCPDEDIPLKPKEVIRRLRKEFRYVKTSKKKGLEEIQGQIDFLARFKGKRARDKKNRIDELESYKTEAYWVVFGDDPESKQSYLCTVVTPEDRLFFGYSSASHERAAKPLLERCAKALSYEIEEV